MADQIPEAQIPQEPVVAEESQEEREAKVLAWVDDKKKRCLEARRFEELEWQGAWQFYNGHHWGGWTEEGSFIDEVNDGRPHVTVNYIVYLALTRLGHLLKNKPTITTLPGSADEQARNATRLANKAIPAVLDRHRFSEKLTDALRWALVPGKCFLKACWDFSAGRFVEEPGELQYAGDGKLARGEDGREVRGPPKRRKVGDLSLRVVYPYQVLVEGSVVSLDDAPYLLDQAFMPMATIRKRWPGHDLRANAESSDNYETVRRLRASDPYGQKPEGGDEEGEVIEAWIKADGDAFLEDTYAVIACGKVVELKTWPDGYRDQPGGDPIFPYVSLDDVKGNTFWSSSYVRNVIPLNRLINREVSEQEHVRRVHKPKILNPRQSLIDPDAWDDRPDEIVDYQAPHPPSYLKPTELPVHHIESKNWIVNAAKEIGGSWDLMSGRVHGEIRSGRQTAYLLETAGVVLYLVAQQTEAAIERLGNIILRLLQEYLDDDSYEVYVGKNRRAQVIQFRGADLRGAGQVRVQAGSMMPMTRMERYDRVEEWVKQKIIPPEVGLRMLELGDFDLPMFESEELDRQNADEAVLMLQAVNMEEFSKYGEQSRALAEQEGMLWNARYVLRAIGIEAFPWDNHTFIVKHLNDTFRKTQDYRFMPKPLRLLVDAYVGWHEAFILSNGQPIETPVGAPARVESVLSAGAARGAPGVAFPIGTQPAVPPGAPAPPTGQPTPTAPRPGQPTPAPPGPAGAIAGGGPRPMPQTSSERARGLPGIPHPAPPGGRNGT